MEDGTERPVGFASRTLSAAEIKYSQLDKEGGAIMFALKKFHKQIYGPCFVIMTDHKPLVSLHRSWSYAGACQRISYAGLA